MKWLRYQDSKYLISEFGNVYLESRAKEIVPFEGGTGKYLMVNLWHNNKNRLIAVHRLVAECYIPNPLNKRTVNHIDGCRKNNSVGNLEWSTYSENLQHAVDTGLAQRGETKVNAKLTDAIVAQIKLEMVAGKRDTLLADTHNVHSATISEIRRKRTWKHVLPDLELPILNKKVTRSLRKDDIPEIRRLFKEGLNDAEIGKVYGMARGSINSIRSGKTWKNY